MEDSHKIEWSAPEYEERERSRDWFWALGVIVTTASIAAVIFGNYFFAALIIFGGAALSMFSLKKPEMVNYELGEQGLRIRTNLYRYDSIKAFWVETRGRDMLFLKSSRVFLPMIMIPIPSDSAQNIRNVFLSKQVPEEEMEEHLAERVLEILGF